MTLTPGMHDDNRLFPKLPPADPAQLVDLKIEDYSPDPGSK